MCVTEGGGVGWGGMSGRWGGGMSGRGVGRYEREGGGGV